MEDIELENEKFIATCTKKGKLIIFDKTYRQNIIEHTLFQDNYEYMADEWEIVPELFFDDRNHQLLITYGISYVFFVSLAHPFAINLINLYPEVSYEGDNYEKVDFCCYYLAKLNIYFSPLDQYILCRVRGDYDPQEEDGLIASDIYIPKYFRTVFLIDLKTQLITFTYEFTEEYGDIISYAFSRDDELLALGAHGGKVRMFEIKTGALVFEDEELTWVLDSRGIRDRKLIGFAADDYFYYVNGERNIVCVKKEDYWKKTAVIDLHIPKGRMICPGVFEMSGFIYDVYVIDNEFEIHAERKYEDSPFLRAVVEYVKIE